MKKIYQTLLICFVLFITNLTAFAATVKMDFSKEGGTVTNGCKIKFTIYGGVFECKNPDGTFYYPKVIEDNKSFIVNVIWDSEVNISINGTITYNDCNGIIRSWETLDHLDMFGLYNEPSGGICCDQIAYNVAPGTVYTNFDQILGSESNSEFIDKYSWFQTDENYNWQNIYQKDLRQSNDHTEGNLPKQYVALIKNSKPSQNVCFKRTSEQHVIYSLYGITFNEYYEVSNTSNTVCLTMNTGPAPERPDQGIKILVERNIDTKINCDKTNYELSLGSNNYSYLDILKDTYKVEWKLPQGWDWTLAQNTRIQVNYSKATNTNTNIPPLGIFEAYVTFKDRSTKTIKLELTSPQIDVTTSPSINNLCPFQTTAISNTIKGNSTAYTTTWSVENSNITGTGTNISIPVANLSQPTNYINLTIKDNNSSCFRNITHASTINVNSTNLCLSTLIPDINFENKLIQLGIDTDGQNGRVLTSSINTLTSLDISNSNISNLTGIQDFKALQTLRCNNNQLTVLNLSSNLSLINLFCNNNKISSLDVSLITNLKVLECYSNPITNLILSSSITTLKCQSTQLTTINISKCASLDYFDCNSSYINSLDVSQNNKLTFLNCNNNKLTNLDITANPLITTFDCSKNLGLSSICVFSVYFANTNSKYIKDLTATWSETCGFTLIPDPNFEKKLIALGIDNDGNNGKVIKSRIVNIISLDVSNSSITDLTGIQDFKSILRLVCISNKITKLDLSNNISIQSILCYNNKITDINVSKNINLTGLYCNSNSLTNIDVSKNIVLKYFSCDSNAISQLDLSLNPNLNLVTCSYNLLKTLELSKNPLLWGLICNNNQIVNLNLGSNSKISTLVCNDNNLNVLNTNIGRSLYSINCNNNPLLKTICVYDPAYASTNTNFIKDNTASWDNCSYTAIPDVNFEAKLISLGIDKDGVSGAVLTSSISSITSLNVSSSNISNLTGIEGFQYLSTLHCEYNVIKTIDLTKNIALTGLFCYNNQLSSIDLSKNINLTGLYCHYNNLTSLDVSQTIMRGMDCSRNQLTSLTLNTSLQKLDSWNNKLTNVNFNNCPSLFYLTINNNLLTNLYLVKNTALTTLNCSSNSTLSTICVANVNYASNNVNYKKDAVASYSQMCGVQRIGEQSLSSEIPTVEQETIVYPNPTESEITIENNKFKNNGEYQLKIMNSIGQVVYPLTTISDDKIKINMSDWKSGIYIICISSENNKMETIKVVLQ